MIPSCPTLGWWVVCLILPVCLFVVRVAVALASPASPSAHESAMLMEWPASAVGGLWVLVFVCRWSLAVFRALNHGVCVWCGDL